ncbi:Dual specificity phosphatase, catalytic domain protein [Ascosphaera apis ARSEF 7405]|uniref:Dual specificity phosphatase, catalytic domain protein n=1 Tax=Ascosphaera apis ARSEF 7405 TaxID=392613 RepID=A0A167W5V5_9EURO|nr:Dual specificity phosphatase, catalytic domain protein [Ascosphaera apis ARSEF 7405]
MKSISIMSMYREHMNLGQGSKGVMSNGYLSTQPYSHGTSSFPVERPVDYYGVCEIEPPTSHDYPEGYFACPEFFRTIGPEWFYSSPFPHNSWTYEMRRTAQAILPHLYLGPVSAAKDIEFLRREGITLLLAIRSRNNIQSQLVSGDKSAAALGIQSKYIEVDSEQELISVFQVIIQQINDHLCRCAFHRSRNNIEDEPHKKVLVFCDTGNHLSAGVVAAYLMAMFNYDSVKAMSNLAVRRLSAVFDEPMRRALHAFEDIIMAVRTVYQSASNRSAPSLGSVGLPAQWIYTSEKIPMKKRGSCVVTEEDAQALKHNRFGGGDEERFAGRDFTAPFEDA